MRCLLSAIVAVLCALAGVGLSLWTDSFAWVGGALVVASLVAFVALLDGVSALTGEKPRRWVPNVFGMVLALAVLVPTAGGAASLMWMAWF